LGYIRRRPCTRWVFDVFATPHQKIRRQAMTTRRKFALSAVAAVTLSSLGASALAQATVGDYPKAAIRFVVPASAGGPSDTVARMIADKLTPRLGQTVLVENRPGANQTLGTAHVANAPADGYTMLVTTSTPI